MYMYNRKYKIRQNKDMACIIVIYQKGWFQGELWTSSPTQFEPFSDAA